MVLSDWVHGSSPPEEGQNDERYNDFWRGFGVWDILYYAGLKALAGWPASWFTWDCLFLIPKPWYGLVLAPVLISAAFLVAAFRGRARPVRCGFRAGLPAFCDGRRSCGAAGMKEAAAFLAAQDYCIYLDVWYEGGGNAWGLTTGWPCRPHDWEYSAEVFYPEKPVKKIQCFVFLRKGSGRVWFDDVFLERRAPSLGVKKTLFVSDFPRTRTGIQANVELWKDAAWEACLVDAAGLGLETFSGRGARVAFASEGVGVPASLRLSAKAGSETFEETLSLPAFETPGFAMNGVCAVWTADSMRCVTPRTHPSLAEVEQRDGIVLDVARNESESAQILVTAGAAEPVRRVAVELSPLVGDDGRRLDGGVAWQRVGYVRRPRPFRPHPCGVPDAEGWLPDPLLPAASFDVRAGATQGVWLTVRVNEAARPGRYAGCAVVSADGKTLKSVPITVRVRNLCNPRTFGMPTAFCVMDGFTRAQYPARFEEMKRKTHDLMLDHRLNPDDISRTEPPRVEDLLHARERGMNRFNVKNTRTFMASTSARTSTTRPSPSCAGS